MEHFEPVPLIGTHVRLDPLRADDIDALVAAASGDRSTFGWTTVPDGHAAMTAHVERLLRAASDGTWVPYVQRRVADDRVVGQTNYLELRSWRGRQFPDEVEIGGTWLAAEAQRSPVNTEAKLLLLTQAFEVLDVLRVAVATDARNERSRNAIARIGARFEGVLRHHRWSHVVGEEGLPRDTAVFGITNDDWPQVKTHLITLLNPR